MAESGIYVYVSHQGSRQISVLRMSPATGELSRIQDVEVNGKAMPMAVTPDLRFLFAALRTEPYSIVSLAIYGASGMLTPLGNAPATESSPYISTDRTGRFLLAAYNPAERSRRAGLISVSAISQQGYVFPPHQVIRRPRRTRFSPIRRIGSPSHRAATVTSWRDLPSMQRRASWMQIRCRRCWYVPVRGRDISCSIRTIASCIC